MKKIVLIFLLLMFFIVAPLSYAGQDGPCKHLNYIITYSSEEENLNIKCADCDYAHNYDLDSVIVDSLLKNLKFY